MKYYLAVLKEFFRLKWNEFKEWLGYSLKELISIIIFIIGLLSLLSLFYFGLEKNIFWCKIIIYIICGIGGLCILMCIGVLIYVFFEWLIGLIKSNWKQAKKNVNKSKK